MLFVWIEGDCNDVPGYNNNSILMEFYNSAGISRQTLARQIANMEWT
ncbi:MAG: hypothetical protein ACERKZ_14695 [Lachnotalea sp.]